MKVQRNIVIVIALMYLLSDFAYVNEALNVLVKDLESCQKAIARKHDIDWLKAIVSEMGLLKEDDNLLPLKVSNSMHMGF